MLFTLLERASRTTGVAERLPNERPIWRTTACGKRLSGEAEHQRIEISLVELVLIVGNAPLSNQRQIARVGLQANNHGNVSVARQVWKNSLRIHIFLCTCWCLALFSHVLAFLLSSPQHTTPRQWLASGAALPIPSSSRHSRRVRVPQATRERGVALSVQGAVRDH